jgi:hypothetical protein
MEALNNLRDYIAENRTRVLPQLLIFMILLAVVMYGGSTLLPQVQQYNDLSSAVDANNEALSQIEVEDNMTVLQAQITRGETERQDNASFLLTADQAESIIDTIYQYASESGVAITALQTQQPPQIVENQAYSIRSYRLRVSGPVPLLTNFVARFREVAAKSVVVKNLTIESSEGSGILTTDILLYISRYASGEGLADLPEPLPPLPQPIQLPEFLATAATVQSQATEPSVDQSTELQISKTNPAEIEPIVETAVIEIQPLVTTDIVQPFGTYEEALVTLINVQTDLQLLASQTMGDDRPEGWRNTINANNPDYAILTRLNLELLAGALLGADQRPVGWYGARTGALDSIAYDARHDLEVLAEAVSPGNRPADWTGDSLYRCGRSVQTLAAYLEANYDFTITADPAQPDYCAQAELEATTFADTVPSFDPISGASAYQITTDFGVAFLDRSAVRRAGVIPRGTSITPVGRSYAQFSNMMLVSGADYQVYIDYHSTSVTESEFRALPDVTTLAINPACQAQWCE